MKEKLTKKNLDIASIILMGITLLFGYKLYQLNGIELQDISKLKEMTLMLSSIKSNIFWNLVFVGLVAAAYTYSGYSVNKDKPKNVFVIIAYIIAAILTFYVYRVFKQNFNFSTTLSNGLSDLKQGFTDYLTGSDSGSGSSNLGEQVYTLSRSLVMYGVALIIQFLAGIPSLVTFIKEKQGNKNPMPVTTNTSTVNNVNYQNMSRQIPDSKEVVNKSLPNMPNMPKMPKMPSQGNSPMQMDVKSIGKAVKDFNYQEKAQEYQEKAQEYQGKVEDFVNKEGGNKGLRIAGILAAVIAVLFLGFKVFGYVTSPVIDLTEKCKLTAEGVDGEGRAYAACSIDTNSKKLNMMQENDLNAIYWEVKPNSNLSNGDKVKIVAKNVDEESLKKKGLRVKNKEKEMKVSGLKKAYRKYENIPTEDREAMDEAAKELIKIYVENDQSKYEQVTSFNFDSIIGKYYTFNGEAGTLKYIYHVSYIYQYDDDEPEEKNEVYSCTISDISPDNKLELDFSSDDVSVSSVYGGDTYNEIIRSNRGSAEVVEEVKGDFKID